MTAITASVVSQPISASVSGAGEITATVGSSSISSLVGGGIGPQGPAGVAGATGATGATGAAAAEDARWNLFLPYPPEALAAFAGVSQATLTWNLPDAKLELPPTDYNVQYKAGSGDWVSFSRAQSTARVVVVTGLTNGLSYRFRVRTVTQIGTGEYSGESNAVTPAETPAPTQLLMHFDGTGNAFVDSSAAPRAIEAFGSVTQSTAKSKFGGKSGLFSGGYLQATGIEFGPVDFAVEFFINTTTSVQYATAVSVANGTFNPGAWTVLLNDTQQGSVAAYVADYSTSVALLEWATDNVCDGEWHHIAFIRSGNNFALYIDGVRRATRVFEGSFSITGSPIAIGDDTVFNVREFEGNIDELRILSGSAAGYSGATLTVPTAPFTA